MDFCDILAGKFKAQGLNLGLLVGMTRLAALIMSWGNKTKHLKTSSLCHFYFLSITKVFGFPENKNAPHYCVRRFVLSG